jgi:hypothetical protein
LKLWEFEKWWAAAVSGDPSLPPKYSYAEALERVPSQPISTIARGKPLNVTSITRDRDYEITWNTYEENENSETASSRYA